MTTYLILGVVGLLVLAVSLLVGDVFDGLLDGALDGLGGDWFSTEVVGGFVSALGFGGAIAVSAGAPGPVAVVVGLVVGTAFAWLAARLTRLVRGAGTDESPHCYKRLPEVLQCHAGTIRILHTLRPIGVAMAGADEHDPYRD